MSVATVTALEPLSDEEIAEQYGDLLADALEDYASDPDLLIGMVLGRHRPARHKLNPVSRPPERGFPPDDPGKRATAWAALQAELARHEQAEQERASFYERTRRDMATGCLIWQGPPTQQGYGQMRHDGRAISAHARAWQLERGPLPRKFRLRNLCGRRLCVDVQHWGLTTPSDD